MSKFLRTDNTTKRIVSVKFTREVDTDPDLSHLGEYSNKPGADDVTIDRQERGDMGHHEYRYFIAAMSGKESGNPESVEQDYQRMEDYNRQGWCELFCQAVAKVSICGVMQTVTSGGLAGVESDSEESYFEDEIKPQELDDLRDILESMGFTKGQIDAAFADCKG